MANQDELLKQSAKDIIYDVLSHYKKAIPWFTGIREDWTLGHLKINIITNETTFRSENFSQYEFEDICYKTSRKIKRNLSATYIVDFAKFNDEPGRLSVGNLIEAIAHIVAEKEPEELKEPEPEKIYSSSDYRSHPLYQLSSGLSYNYIPSIDDIEPSSLVDLLREENLLCFSEDESLNTSNFSERIEVIDKEFIDEDLEDSDVQWTIKYDELRYKILTDINVTEILELAQILD